MSHSLGWRIPDTDDFTWSRVITPKPLHPTEKPQIPSVLLTNLHPCQSGSNRSHGAPYRPPPISQDSIRLYSPAPNVTSTEEAQQHLPPIHEPRAARSLPKLQVDYNPERRAPDPTTESGKTRPHAHRTGGCCLGWTQPLPLIPPICVSAHTVEECEHQAHDGTNQQRPPPAAPTEDAHPSHWPAGAPYRSLVVRMQPSSGPVPEVTVSADEGALVRTRGLRSGHGGYAQARGSTYF